MDRRNQRKRKKTSQGSTVESAQKSKNVSERWNTIDIDENLFADGAVEGFMGLDEINDYDESELKDLTHAAKKKKRKHQTAHQETSEILKMTNSDLSSGEKENTENLPDKNNVNKITSDLESDTKNAPKKYNKRQRRRDNRKESFKKLLKERRKKRKEKKKQEKESNGNSSNHNVCNPEEKSVIISSIENSKKFTKAMDMSDWEGLGVPEEILRSLEEQNFLTPTPIQKETLPHAIIHRKDIIGAAETGSGKTLAFGIPLIRHIMELKQRRLANLAKMKTEDKNNHNFDENNEFVDEGNDSDDDKPLYALILTPTRELALQIHSHITEAAKYTSIKSAVVVGGLAAVKQERLLSRCPEIVIGTPGRLHKLITNGEVHLNKFSGLKFFVLDECDRMLDQGHFKELDDIVNKINSSTSKKQVFLFSATLTLPQHKPYYKKSKQEASVSHLQSLVNKVGLSPKAKVIDLTTKHITASLLQQLKVMCTNEEKEMYLLYFLMTHPGRTIVFVNSIALTKKLSMLLDLLGREPLQLHAGKQQRQRLKYLDRFVNNENGLLIATDVAARGLDIPKVQYVVHFQLPNDPKVYVHRAGRTARAKENGLSFILHGTEDFNAYKKITQFLKLNADIPSMNVDRGYLDGVKARVALAKEIDKREYKTRQQSADHKWMNRAAKSMDLELDDENGSNVTVLTKKEIQSIDFKKKQLKKLLNTKLVPKGFSGIFPTRNGCLASLGTLV